MDIAKSAAAQAEVTVTETQIGTWRFDAISADVNSLDDVRDFITQLDAYPRKDRTVIKYSLVGAVDLATRQHLEAELARLRPLFAHLYPRTRTMNLTTAATTWTLRTWTFPASSWPPPRSWPPILTRLPPTPSTCCSNSITRYKQRC